MTNEILSEIRGHAGVLTLNRPKAINALNQTMIDEMTAVLRQWQDDDRVKLVILRGAGDRGLCAGGDVAALYHDALEGGTAGAHFWKTEYELNYLISTYSKPYVALMEGIVLGGGIGVSAHASHRIVSEDSRIGMPEVGIGYSPDAGGSYLLSQAADRLGRHLAYTAIHVGAAEAIDTGFADYFVPKDKLDALVERLVESGDPADIEKFTEEVGRGFGEERAEMVEVYAAETAEETLARLQELAATRGDGHWAAKAAKRMSLNSPLGIRVTEESLNRTASMSFAETLTQEFWMSVNMQKHKEFVEGIRAQIIDKDRNPSWEYESIGAVPADVVASILEPGEGSVEAPAFDASED
ncbi:enoyl-CoA hydratase/isomerase family protein [Corynebacterium sp. HMSC062A03]|uniref:enoyl-CoA hydratase/isomerase family protein n=1 Tax=Corynebacterium sp. HMSC062A03 TaxID=1739285 RepID=UPI0008A51E54|nr:enoyl-CoA hydratase/isomerase family protein [Corynebacterium sp. HMSC062A03]OFL21070.1 enoyl-CoA hydratase [Corynebacterium sp. HMSC062A03]